MAEQPGIVVLGVGNVLRRDEGVGVHAVRALEERLGASVRGRSASLRFVDGGTLGLGLLPVVESCHDLLILDAVDASLVGGAVVELSAAEIAPTAGCGLSVHQVAFQDVLALAAARDALPPRILLVGVQVDDLGIGTELSPRVAAAVDEMLRRAESVLRSWGAFAEATSAGGANGRGVESDRS